MTAPAARASNAPRDARRAARLAIQAAAAAAEAAWTPACMDAEEFALWRHGQRAEDANASRGLRPCHDCPLGYAAEMRAINQCNGTPGEKRVMSEAGRQAIAEAARNRKPRGAAVPAAS